MVACGHGPATADQDAGACLKGPDGSIGGPPPENCPNDRPTAADCPDASPNYQADIARIVAERCTVCHAPGGIAPTPLFGSYDEIHVTQTQQSMFTFIYSCRMPPTCAPQLTAEERKTMLKWFVCGALNN